MKKLIPFGLSSAFPAPYTLETFLDKGSIEIFLLSNLPGFLFFPKNYEQNSFFVRWKQIISLFSLGNLSSRIFLCERTTAAWFVSTSAKKVAFSTQQGNKRTLRLVSSSFTLLSICTLSWEN